MGLSHLPVRGVAETAVPKTFSPLAVAAGGGGGSDLRVKPAAAS